MARNRNWRVNGPYEEWHHGTERWRVVIVGPSGDRENIFTSTEAEAKQAIEKAKVEILSELTFEEVIERYRMYLTDKGNKKKSIDTTIDRFYNLLPINKPLSSLTTKEGEKLYARRCKAVAVDTHRNELDELKTFFRWTVKEKLLSKSPFEHVQPIGRRKRGKPQLRCNEAMLFRDTAFKMYKERKRGYETALGNLIVLYLGLRSSEVQNILVRDVDPTPQGLLLWVAEETEGKTLSARRHLEVPDDLAELVLQQAESAKARGDKWLFPAETRTGHRGSTWLRRGAERICKDAGIEYVCPHGLRGTNSTLATDAGVAGHLVSKQLGHANQRVTEQHYLAHGAKERARSKRFFEVLDGGKKEERKQSVAI